ncbi:MAG: family 10 glycosylhydrolase [Bacilli bacterium]
MKIFRKMGLMVLFFGLVVLISLQSVKAYNLVGLTISGSNVNHYNTSTQVQIPDVYEKQKYDMRGVWISAFAGDVAINGVSTFQTAMNTAIDTMKYFNLNTMVFHIRTHNDAFYPTALNPKSNYVSNIDFNTFDPLEWLITRCHEEGIEFHAWMNPYRVNTSYTFPSTNPASSSSNLLTGTSVTILNPALPVVREFLYDTVMEVIENYDVDAIHFDDYFYADGTDPYRSADDKRLQVDTFIQGLSTRMRTYNQNNNRHVQLGISPTGVYRSGGNYSGVMNGTYDANGNFSYVYANVSAQEHYASYLFSDTKKWVDNEWIDYITPQSYWGFTHATARFADVMDWWAKAVAYKKVNLYSGMGLYMADSTASTYSWQATDYMEAARQIRYVTKWTQIRGTCVYSYRYLLSAKNGGTTKAALNANNIRPLWNYQALNPETRTMTKVTLGQVPNFKLITDTMNWSLVAGARRYAIYRSTSATINSTIDELIAVVGNTTTSYKDTTAQPGIDYTYAIRAISGTNTEGELTYLSVAPPADPESVTISGPNQVNIAQTIALSATVLPSNALQNVTWSSSNTSIATVSSNGFVTGVAQGTVIITAKTVANPSILNTHTVTVNIPQPVSLNISGANTVAINSSIGLTANILPSGANQNVIWGTSNEKIATINSIGVLQGVGIGTVVITATSAISPGVYNTYMVTVTGAPGIKYQNVVITSSPGGSVELDHYDTAYAKNNTIISTPSAGYRLLCLVENGKIVSTSVNYNFITVHDSTFEAYFVPTDKYYVLFLDQSRKLIDIQVVAPNANAVAPNATKIPSKAGYNFINWDKSFTNITSDTLVYPIYQKNITDKYSITVINGNASATDVAYDSTVTVTALNPGNFSYWLRNNEIASYDVSYTFSVYGEEVLEAIDDDGDTKGVEAVLNPNIVDVNLENEQIVFVGGFYLPEGYTLVEAGMLIYQGKGVTTLDFNTAGVQKIKANKISPNKEFGVNVFNVVPGTSWNACTYVSYQYSGVIYQKYSKLETYSLESPDLDVLLSIISTIPTHINTNYTFPTTSGVTWAYQSGQDTSLFNLATGTHTGMTLGVAERTLVGTLNSATSTFEINFGILAEDEVGKFYHSVSAYIAESDWIGTTLTKESDNAVLFLVKEPVTFSYSTATNIRRKQLQTAWNAADPQGWTNCGNLVRNTGTAEITFGLVNIAPSTDDKGIRIGADGSIVQVYDNGANVTLLAGESLWVAKLLDRTLNFGSESDFTVGTKLIYKQIK